MGRAPIPMTRNYGRTAFTKDGVLVTFEGDLPRGLVSVAAVYGTSTFPEDVARQIFPAISEGARVGTAPKCSYCKSISWDNAFRATCVNCGGPL